MSFMNGLVENFVAGMSEDQKRDLLRTAQDQVLASTTPEERLMLARDALDALINSLSSEQRGALALDIAARIQQR
ncbi:MAG: hypothetical protein M3P51_01070 [Chloroflexota bacterium]|nr:hypothetical protein [Chloroflexota bacterium]